MGTTKAEQWRIIADIYNMYDDSRLQDFMDAAVKLFREVSLIPYLHGINLRILMANTAEHPDYTAEFYDLARKSYDKAKVLPHKQEEILILDQLRIKLREVEAAIRTTQFQHGTKQASHPFRVIARETARDGDMKAGVDLTGNPFGQDRKGHSSPETEAESRKRRKTEKNASHETREKRGEEAAGQGETLGPRQVDESISQEGSDEREKESTGQ